MSRVLGSTPEEHRQALDEEELDRGRRRLLVLTAWTRASSSHPSATLAPASELYVDARKGYDGADGSERKPLRSLSAAFALVPDPVLEEVTIHLAAGAYTTTGGEATPDDSLVLWRRMRPGASVRLLGPERGDPAVLAWKRERHMVEVHEGAWELGRLQIGSFEREQVRGLTVHGPARAILEDVRFRLCSDSDAGIWAVVGGHVELRGAIELDEQLGDEPVERSFCGILASDGGVVEFGEGAGASLVLGNANLSVRSYGSIRLGRRSARSSCSSESNVLTVNNGGRIDPRNTETVLRARSRSNVAVGLEHDGHVLAEDAHVTIVGPNDAAIALQKASTCTCNDIELVGTFGKALWASSGSMFVGRFLGDVPGLEARTGASIGLEELRGKLTGEVVAESGGVVALPGRSVRSD